MASSYLTPIDSVMKRREFLTFDIESKEGLSQEPGFTRPFLCGWFDGIHYWHTKSPRLFPNAWEEGGCVDTAMRRILIHENRGKIIYAHNAGRFDYLHVLPWLECVGRHLGFLYRVVPLQSAIQILEVWTTQHRQKWRFLDTVRLLQMPLDKAAKTFGFEGKLDFNLATDESDPSWGPYNEVDTVQLWRVMSRYHHYVEDRLRAEVKISTAGTAMSYFRRNHLHYPIPRSEESHEFVRRGYFGGRVERYLSSGKGLRYYDINSSYPTSMLKPLPCGDCTEWEGEPTVKLTDGQTGFVEAEVDIPDCQYPVLPVRHDNKLMFPVGRLKGVWSWVELERVREHVRWYGKSYWYESQPILASFVHALYEYRDKSRIDYNEGMATIAKWLMNGLYGKFGMHQDRTKLLIAGQDEIPEGAWPADGTPDSTLWYTTEHIDQPYIIPQIAATVTAYSRVMLLDWMLEAERLGGRVYYCDTDSIVTDVVMPTGTALGELKQEYGDNLEGHFVGPKMYALLEREERLAEGFSGPWRRREHVKAKGFGREHRNYAALSALLEGQAIAYDHLEKIGTLAREGFKRGPLMVRKTKRLKTQIHKRVFLADGSSRPIRLEQW